MDEENREEFHPSLLQRVLAGIGAVGFVAVLLLIAWVIRQYS